MVANLSSVFSLLADLNSLTPPGFLTVLQLKYYNGQTACLSIMYGSYVYYIIHCNIQNRYIVGRRVIGTKAVTHEFHNRSCVSASI